MSHENMKLLMKARPKLRKVSPLSHWIVVIMAVFNLFLGVSLFFAVDSGRVSAPLLIVNELFTYQFWGAVFFGLGLLKLYSIFINDWDLSRNTLIAGVAIKSAWAIALTVRSLISPGTIFLNLLWVTLAVIQLCAYIYFMPPSQLAFPSEQRRADRL